MDIVNVITQLISNCGFPIAAFLLMWYQNNKTTSAITKLSETVQANTEAIKDLQEKLN